MKIVIGNDHAGTEYKFKIVKFLKDKDYKVINVGTNLTDSVDYPDFIHPVAEKVENTKDTFGIIICGSGNGAQITANKHQKIRAALCWNNELVALSRQHNNANVLCIPARFVSIQQAIGFVDIFLKTKFQKGRHQVRVDKIPC